MIRRALRKLIAWYNRHYPPACYHLNRKRVTNYDRDWWGLDDDEAIQYWACSDCRAILSEPEVVKVADNP